MTFSYMELHNLQQTEHGLNDFLLSNMLNSFRGVRKDCTKDTRGSLVDKEKRC